MSEPRDQMIECSVCGWRHTVPCGRDDCPHDLATVYATIARELDNAVSNGCMEQLAKMSAEDIAYDLAQHSAGCERIAIPILTAGVNAWLHPQDDKDRNNPEAIRERCRRAADRFVALAANARVDAVVSADLLLEAASLLKGFDQSLLVEGGYLELAAPRNVPLPSAYAEGWHRCVETICAVMGDRHAAEAARIAALEAALRKLMKESAAVLALAEHELRCVAGNTNVAVFKLRVEEAGQLLAAPAVSSPEEGQE